MAEMISFYENFRNCEDVSKYRNQMQLSSGSYSFVSRAIDSRDGRIVALKKMIADSANIEQVKGEIEMLKNMQHDNIIKLIEICRSTNSLKPFIYLVLEFADHSLEGMLSERIEFTLSEKKTILKQILNGLAYIHNNSIIHRDIKGTNVLINRNGIVKLADLGCAIKLIEVGKNAIKGCISFRAPELIFGAKNYDTSVDVWSVGCLIIKLWTKMTAFEGKHTNNIFQEIQNLCGSITPENWPGAVALPNYANFGHMSSVERKLRETLAEKIDYEPAIDLVDKILQLNPSKRLTSEQALEHSFFHADPQPKDLVPTLRKIHSYMHIQAGKPDWEPDLWKP